MGYKKCMIYIIFEEDLKIIDYIQLWIRAQRKLFQIPEVVNNRI